jgi:hypothetical protein
MPIRRADLYPASISDGTVIWTSPSGRTYSTKPGGSVFFPILATPTGEAAIRNLTAEPGQGRGVMMPRRKRTRAEERKDRITAERRIDEQRLKRERWLFEELEKRREALADDEPPPLLIHIECLELPCDGCDVLAVIGSLRDPRAATVAARRARCAGIPRIECRIGGPEWVPRTSGRMSP